MPPRWHTDLDRLIQERFGFQLGTHAANVMPRVDARLHEQKLSPEVWVDRLKKARADDAELRWLVQAFTIGETTFNRDADQLIGIQAFLRQRHKATQRPLKVWSAACASGEEAYTLAILLEEAAIPGTVHGTDLNPASIATATAGGPYSAYRLMPAPEAWKGRWLQPSGSGWRPVPAIRRRVRFDTHNLLAAARRAPNGWDAVVCRNVLIYFSQTTITEVVDRLSDVLATDGVLFLGGSDPTRAVGGATEAFQWQGRTAFRRTRTRAVSSRQPKRPAHSHLAPTRPVGSSKHGGVDPVQAARAAIRSGDITRAERTLDEHLHRATNDHVGLLERGVLHLSRHRFAQARTDLERATRHGRRSTEAHYFLGVVHEKTRNTALATRSFRAAVQATPDHWPSLALLAGLLKSAGQLLAAESHLTQALRALDARTPTRLVTRSAPLVQSAHTDASSTRQFVLAELHSLRSAQARSLPTFP